MCVDKYNDGCYKSIAYSSVMFLSIILLPFFGFFVSSLFGRFIGKKGSTLLVVLFMASAIVLSIIGFCATSLI